MKHRKISANKLTELLADKGVYLDRLTKKGDVFTAKKSYFYRHGNSEITLRDNLMKLEGVMPIDWEDKFRVWPQTSWFVVRFYFMEN